MNGIWDRIRAATASRVGLGRAGDSMTTETLLELGESRARARDAVHLPLDVDALCRALREGPGGAPAEAAEQTGPLVVRSRACDRGEYLRRPDLGRRLDHAGLESLRAARGGMPMPAVGADVPASGGGARAAEGTASLPSVGIVVADGLSTTAVARHAAPMVRALADELSGAFQPAPVVVATQARVAIGDEIGEALGLDEVIVLIGERPGLSVSDSLGGYLTHAPRPGMRDSMRNCVSNIRPGGLGYRQAAVTLARLARGAIELGRSGVDLKDTGGAVEPGAPGAAAVPGAGKGPGRGDDGAAMLAG